MDNNEKYIEDLLNEAGKILHVGKLKIIGFFLKPIPKRFHLPIVLVSLIVIGAIGVYGYNEYIPKGTSASSQVLPASKDPNVANENPIEKRVNDEKVNKKCGGVGFDILNDLSDVGGERFLFPDKYDDYISSPAGALFQGSKKTSWECNLPLISTVSAIPKRTKSIGLFWEFENIVKIILGDGDNRSIRIEVNENGDRGPWKSYKRYLSKKIEKDKEVVMTAKLKVVDDSIIMVVEINQAGWDKPIIINDIPPLKPALLLETNTPEKVRVGINDSLYKGLGSLVRLQTLSIKTGEW